MFDRLVMTEGPITWGLVPSKEATYKCGCSGSVFLRKVVVQKPDSQILLRRFTTK